MHDYGACRPNSVKKSTLSSTSASIGEGLADFIRPTRDRDKSGNKLESQAGLKDKNTDHTDDQQHAEANVWIDCVFHAGTSISLTWLIFDSNDRALKLVCSVIAGHVTVMSSFEQGKLTDRFSKKARSDRSRQLLFIAADVVAIRIWYQWRRWTPAIAPIMRSSKRAWKERTQAGDLASRGKLRGLRGFYLCWRRSAEP